MYAVTARKVTHLYPDGTTGLDNLSIRVKKNEILLLTGPNGSGKTTFLLHINGLLRPTSGRVMLFDFDVQSDLKRARKTAGLIFQNPDLQIVGETVWSDIAFGPQNLGLPVPLIKERVKNAQKAVGLCGLDDKNPFFLSGGEKRRLAIAGILAMDPEVILMDEPFSGLDYAGAKQLLSLLESLKEKGKTLIISTHDVEKAVHLADTMVVLENGSAVLSGPPVKLLKDLEKKGVRQPCFSRFGLPMTPWANGT